VVVSNIFHVHPLFGEDFQFDLYFSDGLFNHAQPATSLSLFDDFFGASGDGFWSMDDSG